MCSGLDLDECVCLCPFLGYCEADLNLQAQEHVKDSACEGKHWFRQEQR